jgi:hypothetical protein
VTGSGLSSGSYREEARFDVVRRFGSQPQASRLPPARRRGRDRRGRCGTTRCRRTTWSESAARPSSRADPRRDRVDERRPVRARSARAGGLAGRDRRRAEGEGAGTAGLQDRPDRRLGAGRAGPPHLVPAIWLPGPRVRAERERARWRLHLVRHRSSLKQRVHPVLLTHGKPCPVSDLFGVRGRQLLARLELPEPWQGTIEASLRLIDELEREISDCERELRRLGADHRYVPLLCTVPGISWVLAYTIAAELGDIGRQPAQARWLQRPLPARLPIGGARPARPARQTRPRYLRWALVEAATHACTHPRLPRPLPTNEGTHRQAARRQGRPGRPRPPTRRSDLAHAHPRAALRSGRRHRPPGRLTGLKEMRHRSELRSSLVLPSRRRREMSPARHPRPAARSPVIERGRRFESVRGLLVSSCSGAVVVFCVGDGARLQRPRGVHGVDVGRFQACDPRAAPATRRTRRRRSHVEDDLTPPGRGRALRLRRGLRRHSTTSVASDQGARVSPAEDPASARGGMESSLAWGFRSAGAGAYRGRMTAQDASATNVPPTGLLARLADLAYRRRGRMVLGLGRRSRRGRRRRSPCGG